MKPKTMLPKMMKRWAARKTETASVSSNFSPVRAAILFTSSVRACVSLEL